MKNHARQVRSMELMALRLQARTKELERVNRTLAEELQKHRQTEDFLMRLNEFSNDLLENSPNPIVVTNIDTSVSYVNPAFENLTGFSISDVISKKSPYPWWPEDMEKLYESENIPGRSLDVNRLVRRYQKKMEKRSGLI